MDSSQIFKCNTKYNQIIVWSKSFYVILAYEKGLISTFSNFENLENNEKKDKSTTIWLHVNKCYLMLFVKIKH